MHYPTCNNRFALFALCVFVVAVNLVGCDDETIIDPFSDRDAYFTIYGYVATGEQHLVRIIPIRKQLERETEPTSLDVEVTTTALSTGVTREWSQVLPRLETGEFGLRFPDSTFGHVFTSTFAPVVGETYEIQVRGRDGETSTARSTIPGISKPVRGPMRVVGDTVFQTMLWPNLTKAPAEILSVYRLSGPIFKPEIQVPAAPVFHTGEGRLTDDGWEIEINLNEDVAAVRRYVIANLDFFSDFSSVEDPLNFPLGLEDIRMRATVGDSAWTFVSNNPQFNELAQPGAASNVQNGFGYFGALATEVDTWLIPDATIRQLIGFSF